MRYARLLILALILTAPLVASAGPRTIAELASFVSALIDSAVWLLITFGIVVYFFGMSANINNFQKDPEKRKRFYLYGIFIIFVMVSIWGIVSLIKTTLFGTGARRTGETIHRSIAASNIRYE